MEYQKRRKIQRGFDAAIKTVFGKKSGGKKKSAVDNYQSLGHEKIKNITFKFPFLVFRAEKNPISKELKSSVILTDPRGSK